MSTMEDREQCREVEDALAGILDGSAPAALFDHVAGCDACRDLKHDAARAAELAGHAGADFRPADDFLEQLVARLEAARPADAESARESPLAPDPSAEHRDAPAEPPSPTTATDPPTATDPHVEAAHVEAAHVEPAHVEPAHVEPAHVEPAHVEAAHVEPAHVEPARAAPVRVEPSLVRPSRVVPPPTEGPGGRVVALFRRPLFVASLLGAAAAAAAAGFALKGRVLAPVAAPSSALAPWSGSVASIARAASDKTGGLELCDPHGACAPAAVGAPVAAGAILRTDARTRAHFALSDGTELALDRGSEVVLSPTESRTARLTRGTLVADVAHVDGSTAHVACAQGDVEVLGTKLAMTAAGDRASIEVARGVVRFVGLTGKPVDVRAGEEATLVRGAEPVVASTSSLADVMEWSDRSPEDLDAPVLRGLGELRAKKPGTTVEKAQAVRLARHAVKVRVVDVVARTEVDETFVNETDDELEGIFRFPLPPGAQIERLALEVDGKLVEGAFVDRDRGAAIWRGVIQHAAPQAPKPKEEIVWVPGPWRDPALLEWQRGGRFELRIFPIPKRGSRRVVLGYTQTVDQAGGVRRYTYPLAHDASGTTRIDAFDLDVQVLGLDRSFGLTTRGYDLASGGGGGETDRRTLHASAFVPAGDLTVEYALPDRDREVTAWGYAGGAPLDANANANANANAGRSGPGTSRGTSGKPMTPDQRAAADAAAAMAADTSPYVAVALRPRLPRWTEAKSRVHVLVVDDSRSMVGERFARATHLASAIVREMDRRDTFLLLACDTTCRPMTAEGEGAARPQAPGASAAGDVEKFLGQLEPDGGSDLAAAMSAARAAAGARDGRELRILYLGDGTPSVGPTRPRHLEIAVKEALGSGDDAVIAVALGSDADTTSLEALARGGGGVLVPYVPGQKVSSAALDVLGAAYGQVLRDVQVDLPAGLTQVTPAHLDPILAGSERFVLARMSAGAAGRVTGPVKLRGRVAGEAFERSYPLEIVASSGAGNAFVPRLYAAAKIGELERAADDVQKPLVIELSKRFAVASRFTSLLVLESEAMFKAFGVDRNGVSSAFTGEEQAESAKADADGAPADAPAGGPGSVEAELLGVLSKDAAKEKSANAGALSGASGANPYLDGALDRERDAVRKPAPMAAPQSAAAMAAPTSMATPTESPAPAAPKVPGRGAPAGAHAAEEAAPSPPPPPPAKKWAEPPSPAASVAGPQAQGRTIPQGGGADAALRSRRRMIPMRKVFDRNGAFDAGNTLAQQNVARLATAEAALSASPDSRDRTAGLYALYATSGRLGEAQELTARWSGRDALDPDALTARADLAARQGDRDRAVRILGGLADLRPNDRAIQARLADLQDAAGKPALACEHRLALADLGLGDPKLVADAVRCARTLGQGLLAEAVRFDSGDRVRDAADRLLALVQTAPAPPLGGDVQLTADWTGGADLDLALIDAQGRRTSWLGSALKGVTASRDATSPRTETLSLGGLPSGSYVMELTRAQAGAGGNPDAASPLRGDLTLRFPGGVRRVPFSLTGARTELGTLRIFYTSRLVPIPGF